MIFPPGTRVQMRVHKVRYRGVVIDVPNSRMRTVRMDGGVLAPFLVWELAEIPRRPAS